MNIGNTGFSDAQKIAYLRTLPAIRERCERVYTLARQGKLGYFDYDPDKEDRVADYCIGIMKRDFGDAVASIPPHGRWRHLDAGASRIEPLLREWDRSPSPPDIKEKTKRLIDLFLVSVLLDAGAGDAWKYRDAASDISFSRSEGLGVASFHMFSDGLFSGDASQPHKVDAAGLAQISAEKIAEAMQVSTSNPMVGLEGRASLLVNLSAALKASPTLFGDEGRPGNMLDFLEQESKEEGSVRRVPVAALWHVLMEGLAPIWPKDRTTLAGIPLGDVWPCDALQPSAAEEWETLVPFHKLTGWTTYSLIEPMEKILGWKFDGKEQLTGLPEYRNGGLLVDLGVLALKISSLPSSAFDAYPAIPQLSPSHPAIIEWRAMTVIELDRVANLIRQKLGLSAEELTLAQVLESATWKGGREIAREKRPETGGPPISILSDGTVF